MFGFKNQNRLDVYTAALLIAFSIVGAIASYPPPVTTYDPLFGLGSGFAPMMVLFTSYVSGIIGGGVVSRSLVNNEARLGQRLAIRVSVSGGVLLLINLYVSYSTGWSFGSSFTIYSTLAVIVFAAVDEIFEGFLNKSD